MTIMDSKAQHTVDVIVNVVQGKISLTNAAKLENKSSRTIEATFNRISQTVFSLLFTAIQVEPLPLNYLMTLIGRCNRLIKEKYYDVNLQHLAELLATHEDIQIKRETLRNWAHAIHHVKRAKRRRSQVRKRRARIESAGLLLQMDGSPHRWFGNEKSCLIAIIDDATSEIHAEFFTSETTQAA